MFNSRALIYLGAPVSSDDTVEHYSSEALKYHVTRLTPAVMEYALGVCQDVEARGNLFRDDPLGNHMHEVHASQLEWDASLLPAIASWRSPPIKRALSDSSASTSRKRKRKDNKPAAPPEPSPEERLYPYRFKLDRVQPRHVLLKRALIALHLAKMYAPPRWACTSHEERARLREKEVERASKEVRLAYQALEKVCLELGEVGELFLGLVCRDIPLEQRPQAPQAQPMLAIEDIEWEDE